MVTFLLSLLAILGISLMLFSAVALVQDKRLMGSAPKEAQELVQAKPERFKGQHILGWVLLLMTRSHFFEHYYPELEGVEAYNKYGFNLKSQIIRIIVYPFICVFTAWICAMI